MAVVAPEEANDYGWNQQGVEGAEAAAESVGRQDEVVDGAGYEDISRCSGSSRRAARRFIIAQASGYNTAAPAVAAEFNVPVIVYDKPGAQTAGLVANVTTSSQEGAYLAGVLAARTTQTGTLGIVDLGGRHQLEQAGRRLRRRSPQRQSGRPVQCLRRSARPGTPTPRAAGASTETVIAGGADVVFGMGDGSSFGMIQAVETATPPEGADKVWFIDVIGDKTLDRQEGSSAVLRALGVRGIYTQAHRRHQRRHVRERRTSWTSGTAASRCSRRTSPGRRLGGGRGREAGDPTDRSRSVSRTEAGVKKSCKGNTGGRRGSTGPPRSRRPGMSTGSPTTSARRPGAARGRARRDHEGVPGRARQRRASR